MSKCISHRGEYEDHEFDSIAPEFVCTWCGVFDEAAADAALDEARAKIARVEALARRWETVPALRRGTCAADLRIALRGEVTA